ncbi:MAG: hypothetical protein OGM67_13275 [Oscillospiraceae bacterium]|nr:MAG: hypothetical protein OGM67_13275 [Oscillospiraceae bacterium]
MDGGRYPQLRAGGAGPRGRDPDAAAGQLCGLHAENEVIPTELEEIPSSLFYRQPENTVTVQQGSDGLGHRSQYRETWVDGAWTRHRGDRP